MNATGAAWEIVVVHVLSATLCSLAALALVRSIRTRASVSYAIWVATSVTFLIPIAVVVRALSAGHSTGAVTPPLDWLLLIPAPSTALAASLLVGWAIVFGFALRRLLTRCRAARTLSRAIARGSGELDRRVVAGRVVSIRTSALLECPAAVGFFRQSIVLPSALVGVLSVHEVDAIVLHELTHVRRFDNLVQVLHAVVCCLFWFHPLVWIIGVRLRQARELSADEPVIEAGLAGDLLSGLARLAGVRDSGTLMATATAEWEVRLAHLAGDFTPASGRRIFVALTLAWIVGIAGASRIAIVTPSPTGGPSVLLPPQHAVTRAAGRAPAEGIYGGVPGGVTGGPRGGVKGGILGGVR